MRVYSPCACWHSISGMTNEHTMDLLSFHPRSTTLAAVVKKSGPRTAFSNGLEPDSSSGSGASNTSKFQEQKADHPTDLPTACQVAKQHAALERKHAKERVVWACPQAGCMSPLFSRGEYSVPLLGFPVDWKRVSSALCTPLGSGQTQDKVSTPT